MKFTVEEVSQVVRKLNVEVPVEDVRRSRQQVLKKLQRTAKFKGFRPGKAPLSLVESNYGPQADMDTIEELLNRYYPQIMQESGLSPLGQPKFDFKPLKQEEDFAFSVEIEVRPEFNLETEGYLGLALEEPDLKVDKETVNKSLEQLRERQASLSPMLEIRPVAAGDVVEVDYQTFEGITANALEDKVSGADLDTSPGVLLPDIEKALLGRQVGDKIEAFVDFDENAQTPQFKGKRVRFVMEIKALKKKELPELNDDFVQKNWPDLATVDKLRERISKDMEERFAQQKEQAVRQQIIEKVGQLGQFEIPPSLIRDEQERMVRKFKEYLQMEGVGSLPGFDEQTLLGEVEDNARQKVRAGLVLSRIAEQEKIEVEQVDIEEEFARQAGSEHPVSQVRDFYMKNNMMPSLIGRILEDKTLRRLKEAANIAIVDPAKLSAGQALAATEEGA